MPGVAAAVSSPRRRGTLHDASRRQYTHLGGSVSAVACGASRGIGIDGLAEHPDWTYWRIAEEINARVEGATTSKESRQVIC